MTQADLFPLTPDQILGCLHGRAIGTSCEECVALLEAGCAEFDRQVAAGTFNDRGYTPAELAAKSRPEAKL